MFKKVGLVLICLLFMFTGCAFANEEGTAIYLNYKYEPFSSTIYYRAVGEPVKVIQSLLKEKNYYNGDIDGSFGPSTLNALYEYNRDNEIFENGIGLETVESLGLDADEFFDDIDVSYNDIIKEPHGNKGRLVIDTVNVELPLYYYNGFNLDYAQFMVDCYDSGTIDPTNVICDHSSQDFYNLFSVKVGDTCYIEDLYGNKVEYKCVEICNGRNDEYGLRDYIGAAASRWVCDLSMYTCVNEEGTDVLIVKWVEV